MVKFYTNVRRTHRNLVGSIGGYGTEIVLGNDRRLASLTVSRVQ